MHSFCASVGIPDSTFKNMLKNQNPTLTTIGIVCRGFGIDICDFFISDFKDAKLVDPYAPDESEESEESEDPGESQDLEDPQNSEEQLIV